jgi:exopolysaccharide biosynthesis polyprenyl glycosylphosphotransferase
MGGRSASGRWNLAASWRENADASGSNDAMARLASETYSIQASGLVFFLTDGALLLVAAAASLLFVGTLSFAVATFVGILLLLQLRSELQHPHRTHLSALEEIPSVARRACVAYALASALDLITGSGDSIGLLVLTGAAVPLLLIGRAVSYTLERSRRRKGQRSRTLVIGRGEVAERIVSALHSCPEFGLEVVSVIDDDTNRDRMPGKGMLGALQDISEVIHSHCISTLIVSFNGRSDDEMAPYIRKALSKGITVWVIPRFHEVATRKGRVDDLWGLPLVRLVPPGPAQATWPLKRAFDVVCSGVGLLLAGPVLAVIVAMILIESGRPVLFRQRRVGATGLHFDILKFRTMTVCSREVNETEWVADEARTTRVGRLLRASGLDELPQLLNVLKGDMSLVGPRPERPFFVDQFARLYPRYEDRHRVAGGITGLSQIRGLRGNTSVLHRTVVDNYYIDTWDFWTDVKIILKSVPCLIRGQELRSPVNLDEVATTNQTVVEVESPPVIRVEPRIDPPAPLRSGQGDVLTIAEQHGTVAFTAPGNSGGQDVGRTAS